ncbi:MAG: hypothetical protein KGL39_58760, partial [Patescibacteria group bacterium]|nr:hypothetical protein [Patescibacteria group bacterium]
MDERTTSLRLRLPTTKVMGSKVRLFAFANKSAGAFAIAFAPTTKVMGSKVRLFAFANKSAGAFAIAFA